MHRLPVNTVFACDIEASGFNWEEEEKEATNVHMTGLATCLSIYAGDGVDFGSGPGIWIDDLNSENGTLETFKVFLESHVHMKTWHNYSFDKAVLWRGHQIDCQGLAGDTMHMARIW